MRRVMRPRNALRTGLLMLQQRRHACLVTGKRGLRSKCSRSQGQPCGILGHKKWKISYEGAGACRVKRLFYKVTVHEVCKPSYSRGC